MTLYTITQIAERMGISRSAVHQRVLRRRANGEKLGAMHGGVWLYTEAEVKRITSNIQEASK